MIRTIPATTLRHHLGDALRGLTPESPFLLVTRKNRPMSALVNLDFLEDLLAAHSPDYVKSIREARADYRRGRVLTHQEVFGRLG